MKSLHAGSTKFVKSKLIMALKVDLNLKIALTNENKQILKY